MPTLEEIQAQKAAHYAKLQQTPQVEIFGVDLKASASLGGERASLSDPWRPFLVFFLDAWRIGDSPVRHQQMRVFRYDSQAECERLVRTKKGVTFCRIRGRVIADDPSQTPSCLLESVESISTPPADLVAAAAELQRPVVHDDPTLGRLTLDRQLGVWSGSGRWLGADVRLTLAAPNAESLPEQIRSARELWQRQEAWAASAVRVATSKLLNLKNTSWLDEDEKPLSAEQFQSRLSVETVSIGRTGMIELWFCDGDLFWGHSIRVAGTLLGGPDDADIQG